jgi:hypothetical protein
VPVGINHAGALGMGIRVVHDCEAVVRDPDGHAYRARAIGAERADGTWIGWLEFRPVGSGGLARVTGRETTQPSEAAVRYWAEGLQPGYLEGALVRAVRRAPEDVTS